MQYVISNIQTVCAGWRPDTSQRQRRQVHCRPTSIMPPVHCLSAPWNFPIEIYNFLTEVPFTKKEMPWCPFPRSKYQACLLIPWLSDSMIIIYRVQNCLICRLLTQFLKQKEYHCHTVFIYNSSGDNTQGVSHVYIVSIDSLIHIAAICFWKYYLAMVIEVCITLKLKGTGHSW